MRYLTLAEALVVAAAVTRTDARSLMRTSRIDLLDSALHAPQAGFGEVEFYEDFTDKVAVLAVHIARNHPLPDGNKRLAWQAATMFCAINGRELAAETDEAVAIIWAVAAGEIDVAELSMWLDERIRPLDE